VDGILYAVKHVRFSRKWAQWNPCFNEVHKWNFTLLCLFLSKIHYYRNYPLSPLKWIDFEFFVNRHNKSHALLKYINEILPYFLIFRPLLGKIRFYRKYPPPLKINWFWVSWKLAQWQPCSTYERMCHICLPVLINFCITQGVGKVVKHN